MFLTKFVDKFVIPIVMNYCHHWMGK